MTLEETIRFHAEEAEKMKLHKAVNEMILGTDGYERELQEHTQTAKWLAELKTVHDEIDDANDEDEIFIGYLRKKMRGE